MCEHRENSNQFNYYTFDNNIKTELLSSLWRDTFGDDEWYINLIFKNIYSHSISPLLIKNDESEKPLEGIAGMVGIDYYLGSRSNETKGAYLCGVATRPEFRGKGIMGNMLREELTDLTEKDYRFSFLIPADKGLRDYYSRFGFRSMGNKFNVVINGDEEKEFIGELSRKTNKNCDKNSLFIALSADSDGKIKLHINGGEKLHLTEILSVGMKEQIFQYHNKELDIISCVCTLHQYAEVTHTYSDFINNYEENYKGIIIRHSQIQRQIAILEWLNSGGEIRFYPEEKVIIFLKAEDETIDTSSRTHSKFSELSGLILSDREDAVVRTVGDIVCEYDSKRYTFRIPPRLSFLFPDSLIEEEEYAMFNYLGENENLKFTKEVSGNFKYSILVNDEKIRIEEGRNGNFEKDRGEPFIFLMMD